MKLLDNKKKLKRLDHRYHLTIIVFLIFIAFGGSLRNNYSLDDEFVTTPSNEKVDKGLNGIKEILLTPYSEEGVDNGAFEYRPLTMILFAIEKSVFGFNPGMGHFINLVLYVSIVLLLFQILRILFPHEDSLTLVAILLLFSIHPLHSEVVLSLKNREELLVSLFGFSALYYSIKYSTEQSMLFGIISIFLLVLGVFVKSTITPFVIVIPVTLYFFRLFTAKQSTIFFLVAIVLMGIASFLPKLLLTIPANRELNFIENPLLHLPFWKRLPMAFYSFLYYTKLHLIPFPLLAYYGYNQVPLLSWSDYQVYIGIVLAIASVVIFIYTQKKNKLLAYGILLFVLFILPYMSFPFPATGIIAERFTFNSVLGFSIIVVALLIKISESLNIRYVLLATAVPSIIFIYFDTRRTSQWRSKISLIEHDANVAKNSYKLQAMLGDLYQEQISQTDNVTEKKELFEKTLRAYERAAQIYDQDAGLFNNIGTTFFAGGQYNNAVVLFEKAVELGANKDINHFNLGLAYELSNNLEKAKKQYEIVLKSNADYTSARQRLIELNR